MEKPVLVVAAMEDVELGFLKSKLEHIRKTVYKGFSFFEGEILGKSIVIRRI